MANVAGARAIYGSRTLVGNWSEDRAGLALAERTAGQQLATPTSEARAAYTPPGADASPAVPQPPPIDTLPPRLIFAHGPDLLVDRTAATRYLTVSGSMARGAPSGAVVADAADALQPEAGKRTELIRARQQRVRRDSRRTSHPH
jgi:hypothetical protein